MEYYAGIDVSLESSSICVVDASGRIWALHGDRIQEHLQQLQGSADSITPGGDPNSDDPLF